VLGRFGRVTRQPAEDAEQSYLQPPEHQTDIVHVINGVIEAETGAIEHYNAIIEATDGLDDVTQDMVIQILRGEEQHRRLFEGYLREYEAEGLAWRRLRGRVLEQQHGGPRGAEVRGEPTAASASLVRISARSAQRGSGSACARCSSSAARSSARSSGCIGSLR
jgi:hypothetical protein